MSDWIGNSNSIYTTLGASNQTLGSLFDGIGGFPLCAVLSGITPLWASEIDEFCTAVTKAHFPYMQQLGDITKINGAEIPPVDIITFGSPCQDLSVAGKREGIKHTDKGDNETTRSGLLLEAVRIIYEMRESTNGEYPKYIVWENVAGAFSSHKGQDFRTVLSEITQTDISMPGSGKWAKAGVVRSKEICTAWRLLDAQYWGVPQRRKRIYLIGSFGNDSAEEILFKSESLSGNTEESRKAWEDITANLRRSIEKTSTYCYGISSFESNSMKSSNPNSGLYKADVSRTLDLNGGNPACNQGGIMICQPQTVDFGRTGDRIQIDPDKSVTLQASGGGMGTKTGLYCIKGFPLGFRPENTRLYDEKATTICNGTRPGFCNGVVIFNEKTVTSKANASNPQIGDPCHTLGATGTGRTLLCEIASSRVDGKNNCVFAIDRAAFNQGVNAKYDFEISDKGINSTVVSKGPSAVAVEEKSLILNGQNSITASINVSDKVSSAITTTKQITVKQKYIVRRLTPLECERLQGFPDNWTLIGEFAEGEYRYKDSSGKVKKVTDSHRYMALGNSLAIPCALRVISYIADYLKVGAEQALKERDL